MENGMSNVPAAPSPPASVDRRPRLWPGIVIVLLLWAGLKIPGIVSPGTMEQFMVTFFGSMALELIFLLWWLFLSRARWSERLFGLLACAVVGAAAWYFYHPTVRGKGADGAMFALGLYTLPIVLTGWIIWLVVARSNSRQARLAGLVVVFMMTFGYFTALRFDGVAGAFSPEFTYRWQPTAEDRYIASRKTDKGAVPAANAAASLELTAADWPGFRGPDRDGRRTDVRISTDWKGQKPKQVWRRPIGPGWSSFAIVGSRLYTQEQLGDVERVVCMDADTGNDIWEHTDDARFTEAVSGAGPRATPTFHEGKIYALGATGKLNCLDAASGKPLWSRDIVKDSGAKVPIWGFSSSPLVVNGIVTVYAGGPDDYGVMGYKTATGDIAWHAGKEALSYCSLQAVKIAGVEQLLVATNEGMVSFDPTSGKELWDYEWNLGKDFNRVTQPALVGDSDLLLGSGFGIGTRRVHIDHKGDKWTAEQVWESRAISPYYNDLVVHKGHAYGFHSSFFTCVNLETGKGTWRERGYANGQVLLLPDQDLLVVSTETGDVALIEAKPEARKELARFPAITGKTWNHPVIARGKLYVRNSEEAACYDLTPGGPAVAVK